MAVFFGSSALFGGCIIAIFAAVFVVSFGRGLIDGLSRKKDKPIARDSPPAITPERDRLEKELKNLQFELKLCREIEKRLFVNPETADAKQLRQYLAAVKNTTNTHTKIDRILSKLDKLD